MEKGSGNTLIVALDEVDAALDRLISAAAGTGPAGLDVMTDDELLIFATRVEQLRNRMLVLDRPVVAAMSNSQLAERRMMRDPSVLLSDTLRITRAEAKRRVAAVESLSPRESMTGDAVGARYPQIAALQDSGLVSLDQLRVMLDGMSRVESVVGLRPAEGADPVGPEQLAWAQRTLCENARLFDARELSRVGETIMDCLKPDGDPDRTEAHRRLRRLSLHQLSDGMWRIAGDLLSETGEQLAAVLRPLARPRPSDSEGDRQSTDRQSTDRQSTDRQGTDRLHGEDDRDHGQRLHDALGDLAARAINAGGLPVSGGTPATVIITVDEASLRRRSGVGISSDGARLPIETVLRMADQADIIPTVLSAGGAVLAQGRSNRIATTAQTLALYARDGGCSFPGCRQPPEWCDRHHVIGWDVGGKTDVDNLTLLCSYHHYRFEKHGWSCQMIDGLPYWTAPPRLDPDQKPQLHHRIQQHVESRQRRSTVREKKDRRAGLRVSAAEQLVRAMIKEMPTVRERARSG